MKIKIHNKTRLKKTAELLNGIMFGNDIAYIYLNPTNKEISDIKQESGYDAVRGIITDSDDMFVWNGNYLHDRILKQAPLSNITIPDDFRFSCENNVWLFDLKSRMSYTDAINLIIKYKDKLSSVCPIISDIYIIYGSTSGMEEFPNMEYSNYAEIEDNQIIIYSGEHGLNGFLNELKNK